MAEPMEPKDFDKIVEKYPINPELEDLLRIGRYTEGRSVHSLKEKGLVKGVPVKSRITPDSVNTGTVLTEHGKEVRQNVLDFYKSLTEKT